MNDEAVYRTAPATPGLLIMYVIYIPGRMPQGIGYYKFAQGSEGQ